MYNAEKDSIVSKLEDNFYKLLHELFRNNKIIKNYRPMWLKNPKTQRALEIDFYIPKLKIGFEIQGHKSHFNNDYQKYKDNLKYNMAKKRKFFQNVMIVELFPQDQSVLNIIFRLETQLKGRFLKNTNHYINRYKKQLDSLRQMEKDLYYPKFC